MPSITFICPDGQRRTVDADPGTTVMEAAIDHGIPGIIAECGGACACATCQVYVGEQWVGRLAPMDDMEDAMLESALERRPASRLSCQIEVTPELDGLEVQVAPNET
ncbi:MAG TPA: 2Fe-2S iron-sulfur cluster binding domain-containing protein [Chromatiales bacterium]|nr:2Fe-2S iron-sulfur cluster binding domain-containing protein [Chromatiales bacterium]